MGTDRRTTSPWGRGSWKHLLEEMLLETEIGKILNQIGQELGSGEQSGVQMGTNLDCRNTVYSSLEVRESKACSGN